MGAVDIKNEIFMLQDLWVVCSNVFGVVCSSQNIRKKEMQIIRFLLLESNKKRSEKKQRNDPMFWVRPGRTSIWWDNFCEQVVVDSEWKENFRMTRQSFLSLCLKKVD